jgi:5,10-methylenetetrahydrofolate reductase
MDAGADFIIAILLHYGCLSNLCQAVSRYGIDCPIMPGIMPVRYSNFVRMTTYVSCGSSKYVMELVKKKDPVKDDDRSSPRRLVVVQIWPMEFSQGGIEESHFCHVEFGRSVTRILMNVGAIGYSQWLRQGWRNQGTGDYNPAESGSSNADTVRP